MGLEVGCCRSELHRKDKLIQDLGTTGKLLAWGLLFGPPCIHLQF